MASLRLLAVAAFVALVMVGAVVASRPGPPQATVAEQYAYSLDGQAGVSQINAPARTAVNWIGGPTTAATSEIVEVYISDLLPAETPQKWADFLASLTHGPELADLTVRIATLAEVQQLCGARALGCYFRDEMVSLGEALIDGRTTPEEVARHEYGHHVAAHRTNPPWVAIDWGPKQWASAASICSRVSRGEAFPGNEGRNYAQNPGEAWAETYRLMDERKKGITTATWNIIDQSFFPNEAALQAADRDVLQPWTANRKAVHRRVFGKRHEEGLVDPALHAARRRAHGQRDAAEGGTPRGRAPRAEPPHRHPPCAVDGAAGEEHGHPCLRAALPVRARDAERRPRPGDRDRVRTVSRGPR